MLADAGRNGVTGAIMLANGFKLLMLARLVHDGLATALVGERVTAGGEAVEIVRIKIAPTGRRALAMA